MKFFDKLLNFIYPPKCGICNKICDDFLCSNCRRNIEKLQFTKLKKFLVKKLDEHLYIFKYEDIIRNKIIDYKFKEKAYLYKFFVTIMINNKKICCFLKNYDIIIPIPIHNKRKRKRGYNQTELIAKELATNVENLEYKNNILIKTKNTKAQSTLNRNQRKKNLIGAYEVVNNVEIMNKNVLLLDDVFTTGSTANECSRVLKEAGALKVGIITIAKD